MCNITCVEVFFSVSFGEKPLVEGLQRACRRAESRPLKEEGLSEQLQRAGRPCLREEAAECR